MNEVVEVSLVTETVDPIAWVAGQPWVQMPEDLYIPPDALEVILETFEGPLDLLLYLIRRHNLDILDIPIAAVTHQYIQYIDLMKEFRLELAAEYLVMAALLAEIKSRMLLPKPTLPDSEEDPRAELVKRLQLYEQFKKAAQDLDALPQVNHDIFIARVDITENTVEKPLPQIDLKQLLDAFKSVLKRAELFTSHQVEREPLSIRARMSDILDRLREKPALQFHELFRLEEGRLGVVVSFIAILELLKQSLIDIVQVNPFSLIHIQSKVSEVPSNG